MLVDLNIREDLLADFPNYEYFNCTRKELLDFSVANNLVGQQQESFINYWILKQLREHTGYGAGLDVGCGQGAHFASIGLNDYCGKCHPIYGGAYYPNLTSLAECTDKIFNNDTFNWVVASHILEHVADPIITFRKWCKLLRKDGIIILLMPDYAYEKSVKAWDPSHKTFWSPEDFNKNCILPNRDIMRTEDFNSLGNKFSLNYIGRRT